MKSFFSILRRLALVQIFAAIICASPMGGVFAAGPQTQGTASGLPVPRFVSLKSDRVNVRQGPSHDHQIVWTFTRAQLPVEITAEFETWRRVRDSEGSEGWVQQALLSGRRTALVSPWTKNKTFELRARPSASADVKAMIEARVLVALKNCNGSWCRVIVNDVDGYMAQDALWGVYQGETVE